MKLHKKLSYIKQLKKTTDNLFDVTGYDSKTNNDLKTCRLAIKAYELILDVVEFELNADHGYYTVKELKSIKNDLEVSITAKRRTRDTLAFYKGKSKVKVKRSKKASS